MILHGDPLARCLLDKYGKHTSAASAHETDYGEKREFRGHQDCDYADEVK